MFVFSWLTILYSTNFEVSLWNISLTRFITITLWHSVLRLSLDISKSSSCPSETSKGSVLYSASQLGGDQEEGSEVMEEEEETVNFDDTLSDLEAVSLGLPGHQKQKKSGSMFLPYLKWMMLLNHIWKMYVFISSIKPV